MLGKLNLKLIYLLLLFSGALRAEELNYADSLFSAQKYTEALEIYESLFEQDQFSISMLLKMAYINDALENYPKTLYYLDLYYLKTADRSVVEKIKEISQENNLYGYQYNDSHFFQALLLKYRRQIQVVLFSLMILFTAYVYRKHRKGERPVLAVTFQCLVVILMLYVNTPIFQEKLGIITNDHTLLRSGPSAGAEPIEMLTRGHKVRILEELPAWTKISWDGQEAYVRKGKIQVI